VNRLNKIAFPRFTLDKELSRCIGCDDPFTAVSSLYTELH
jgi:hypothetical protein